MVSPHMPAMNSESSCYTAWHVKWWCNFRDNFCWQKSKLLYKVTHKYFLTASLPHSVAVTPIYCRYL